MQLVYLLYDSIKGSVFAGQVWAPLVKHANQDPQDSVLIISYERKVVKHNYTHPQIKIIQIKRYKYFGRACLWLDLLKTKKYLPKEDFEIKARGAFAGWLAIKLINSFCKKVTIQARGLAAAEYEYSNQSKKILKKILVCIRSKQLESLERKVYSQDSNKVFFESVSSALKRYMVDKYLAPANKVTIAQLDIPPQIPNEQLMQWRASTRTKLQIPTQAKVYCYSGSTHKWQCPHLTIKFFKEKLAENKNCFLLILSGQPQKFELLLQAAKVPSKSYAALSVPHQEIYQYLAAANFGLIFRDKHLLNWVSRPTKVLEYRSAGLEVIHNQTIEWLSSHPSQNA